MKLSLLTFITGIDQMIFLEEQLWGTASAITTNICLTKIEKKYNRCFNYSKHLENYFEKYIK